MLWEKAKPKILNNAIGLDFNGRELGRPSLKRSRHCDKVRGNGFGSDILSGLFSRIQNVPERSKASFVAWRLRFKIQRLVTVVCVRISPIIKAGEQERKDCPYESENVEQDEWLHIYEALPISP